MLPVYLLPFGMIRGFGSSWLNIISLSVLGRSWQGTDSYSKDNRGYTGKILVASSILLIPVFAVLVDWSWLLLMKIIQPQISFLINHLTNSIQCLVYKCIQKCINRNHLIFAAQENISTVNMPSTSQWQGVCKLQIVLSLSQNMIWWEDRYTISHGGIVIILRLYEILHFMIPQSFFPAGLQSCSRVS